MRAAALPLKRPVPTRQRLKRLPVEGGLGEAKLGGVGGLVAKGGVRGAVTMVTERGVAANGGVTGVKR